MSGEIPQKCQNCPVVYGQQHMIQQGEKAQDELILSMMSDDLDQQFNGMNFGGRVMFIGPNGETEQPEVSGDMAGMMRILGSKMLEQVDVQLQQAREVIEKCVEDCPGALTLRDKQDGMSYAVSLCRSPALPGDDEIIAMGGTPGATQIEHVLVERLADEPENEA